MQMHRPTAPTTQANLAHARQVVGNPEQYAHRPMLRRMAWMILMDDRGCAVDQGKLAQMPVETGRE